MRVAFVSAFYVLFAALSLPASGATITLGAEDDAAPWSYADGSGYVNDLVRAAFAEEGWSVQFDVMPYARCKALTLAGALAGCFSASRTPELVNRLLYPREAVFDAHNVLVAREGSQFAGCDATRWGKPLVVGLVNGYEYIAAVNRLRAAGDIRPEISDSEAVNLRMLTAGRLDAALVTVDEVKRMEFLAAVARVENRFKVICDLGSEPAYVVFSLRHPDGAAALAAFERGFNKLRTKGAITRIQLHWRGRLLDSAATKQH